MPTALITGTTSGLGLTISTYLLDRGWQVIGLSRSPSEIEHVEYTHYVVDIGCSADILGIFRLINVNIDLLVNNAAIFSNCLVTDISIETVDQLIDTNLKGSIYVTANCIKLMSSGSKIIFINSVAGLNEIEGQSIYCASKHALRAFAGVLGKELHPKIKVTSIHPGGINTPLWNDQNPYLHGEISDAISPIEIAKLVEFIYSSPNNIEYKTITMFPSIEWH